jgi:predicted AAA+ superfamily ATPase
MCIVEELFNRYQRISQKIQTDFVRSFMQEVNWNARLIGIKGARGVGKTTLLLQYLKMTRTGFSTPFCPFNQYSARRFQCLLQFNIT